MVNLSRELEIESTCCGRSGQVVVLLRARQRPVGRLEDLWPSSGGVRQAARNVNELVRQITNPQADRRRGWPALF